MIFFRLVQCKALKSPNHLGVSYLNVWTESRLYVFYCFFFIICGCGCCSEAGDIRPELR